MPGVRQQKTEEDALGAVHPFRCIQEQGPWSGRHILLRLVALRRRLRRTGKLLRQNALGSRGQRSEISKGKRLFHHLRSRISESEAKPIGFEVEPSLTPRIDGFRFALPIGLRYLTCPLRSISSEKQIFRGKSIITG